MTSGRIRISAQDQALDMWGSVTVGPVDLPEVTALRDAFVRVAALGPKYRLALVPEDPAHWRVAGDALAERARDVVRVIDTPVPSIREWLLQHRIPGLPMQLAIAGDHIGLVCDHRLMDGELARELIPLLIRAARGEWTARPLEQLTERPLSEALRHTLGLRRASWAGLIKHLRQPRPWPASGGFPAGRLTATGPVTTVVGTSHQVVRVDAAAVGDLRRWSRNRLALAPSLLLATSAALAEAGVAIAPQALMIVDLRRYLPRGRGYFGNFITAVRVPPGAMLAEPRKVNAWLTEALVKGRPLAMVALSAVRSRLHPPRFLRSQPDAAQLVPSPDEPVTVSISHHGNLNSIEALPWLADPDNRHIEIVNDVLDADTVGLIAYACADQLYLSASFRTERIPPPVMSQALTATAHHPVSELDALSLRLGGGTADSG